MACDLQAAIVEIDPLGVLPVRLDRRGRHVGEADVEFASVGAPGGFSSGAPAATPSVAIVDLNRRVSSSTRENRLDSPSPSTRSALTMRPVRAS